MLATVAGFLYKTHRKWRVNKEMGGWEMGGRPEFLTMMFIGTAGSRGLFPCKDNTSNDPFSRC